jgi:hypothetical protein
VRADEIAFQAANPSERKARVEKKAPSVVTKPRRIAKP